MDNRAVRLDRDGSVLIVTLDRPEARNAINRAMHRELAQLVQSLRAGSDGVANAGAIVLTGKGTAFSAGGDLDLIGSYAESAWVAGLQLADESLMLVRDFLSIRPPVVAAVNGDAYGLGATLALLCDVVVMADEAVIADTHVKVGIVPGDGGTVLWPALLGPAKAKELLMTGGRVRAGEAERLGLVNRVVAREEVLTTAMEIAKDLAAGPRQAIAWTKQLINGALLRECVSHLPFALSLETASLMHPDVVEGITAIKEGRRPLWPSSRGEE